MDGRKLTFRIDGESLVENDTGSIWNILGRALEGPLAGWKLTHIVHTYHFWFAWCSFKPDTLINSAKG